MSTIRNKSSRVSLAKQLIAGTNKHFSNTTQQLTFGGVTRAVPALTQLLQGFVDARAAVVSAQAVARAKVAAEQTQEAPLVAVIDAYVGFLRATFGKQPDVLIDFGLAPPKVRTPPTAEQAALAVAKRAATRKARGTMGKNQKKSIKGAVNATLVVTPAGSPPAPAIPAGTGSATPVTAAATGTRAT